LEFVGYQEGADEKGVEYAKKKPHIVTESMREFSKDRYGVDVLKVEVPVNMKFVEGTKSYGGQTAYTKKEAIDLFHKAAGVATKPFIYLSAGVSNAEFSETLELAGESGVKFNGVLCGRATWKEGIPIYGKQGADAFRQWLETEGVKNIANVNARLAPAHPWYEFYGAKSAEELAGG
jgi:tagatose 1,6-diphosphate aldolase